AAPVLNLDCYAQVVRAAFGQRRKTLRNALAALPTERSGIAPLVAAGQAGIDLGRRGETLTVAEVSRLAHASTAGQQQGLTSPRQPPAEIRPGLLSSAAFGATQRRVIKSAREARGGGGGSASFAG